MRKRWMAGGAALLTAVVLAGAAFAAAGSSRSGTVTLTLWHNYGTGGNAGATTNLVAAFEKQNPNIKIKVISQPSANYFSLLQASGISHSGPDLAVMWTGLFDLKYEKLLVNLKPYFSPAETARINGLKWVAPNFDPAKGFLVMPLENQFYMGFYNKALFKKAGLSGPPRNVHEAEGCWCHADRLRGRPAGHPVVTVPVVRHELPDGSDPQSRSVQGPLHRRDAVDGAGCRRSGLQVGGTPEEGLHE